MEKIIFALIACHVLSVDFGEATIMLNSTEDEPRRVVCEKIKDAYQQYGCINAYGVSEIFTLVTKDKEDFMLINKTTNKVYHWVGARAAFHNRSMVREGSTEQFCVGRVEIK